MKDHRVTNYDICNNNVQAKHKDVAISCDIVLYTHAIVILHQTSARLRFRVQRRLRRFSLYVAAFHVPIIRSILV